MHVYGSRQTEYGLTFLHNDLHPTNPPEIRSSPFLATDSASPTLLPTIGPGILKTQSQGPAQPSILPSLSPGGLCKYHMWSRLCVATERCDTADTPPSWVP